MSSRAFPFFSRVSRISHVFLILKTSRKLSVAGLNPTWQSSASPVDGAQLGIASGVIKGAKNGVMRLFRMKGGEAHARGEIEYTF